MAKKRIFVALDLSKKARAEIQKIQNELKRLNQKVHLRWVDPDIYHLTLLFIGHIDEWQLRQVTAALKLIAGKFQALKFRLGHLDAFPDKSKPAMIHITVESESKKADRLYNNAANELIKLRIINNIKPWRPHVTLARNKNKKAVQGFRTIDVQKVTWKSGNINVFESRLRADGPQYILLDQIKLGEDLKQ